MVASDRGTFRKFQKSIEREWIVQALEETHTATVRKRRLPAEQVVWLVLGMALFRDLAIDAVVRSLDLVLFDRDDKPLAPSSVFEARKRLGSAPLPVHARCTSIGLHPPVRFLQHIRPVDLVVQGIEPELRLRLGLRVQLPLQLFEFGRTVW